MRNPLIDFFKDFERYLRNKYPEDDGQEFRVPMTIASIGRTVLTLEDAEYFKQTTESLCDQVEEVQKELDVIEKFAKSLSGNAQTFGQQNDVTAIMKSVERIREFYGRVDTDE